MFIDTHIHLNMNKYDADRDEVIQRAVDAGVEKMIDIGTDLVSSRQAVELAQKYDVVYAAVGIHPHEAAKSPDDFAEIEFLLQQNKVVAVGEIGLDYHYDFSPREIQKRVFTEQLSLARRSEMPVIIHVREAMDDALKVIDQCGTTPWNGVFHCYGGTVDEVPEVLNRGFYISFTGIVTFKNFDRMNAFLAVPINRLLIETDGPYMAPVPHRGKRNEPMWLPDIAKAMADHHETSIEILEQATTLNAINCFGLEIE